MTPFRAAEASKQLVIRVRSGKIALSYWWHIAIPSCRGSNTWIKPSLARFAHLYLHVGHARIEYLIREWGDTRALFSYCEAEVRSYSVSVVYVVRLRIVFSKAALQKRGSIEPMEPPLDPPLQRVNWSVPGAVTFCVFSGKMLDQGCLILNSGMSHSGHLFIVWSG